MNLVAVGTVAIDCIETPFGRADDILGGSATHFASAASYFSPVSLIGVVGRDFPLASLDFLKKRQVDLAGLEVKEGKSFRWAGKYHYDLNTRDTLKTELGVIADFSPRVPPSWQRPKHLFLGNFHPRVHLEILEQVRAEFVSMDTMNLWIETERESLEKVLPRTHLVVINQEEARQFTGEYSLVRAVRRIVSRGPRIVVVKQGEYGALLFYKGEIFSAPGLPLEEVRDPTGAGDCFAGGLIGYLAREGRVDFDTLKKGVIVGSAMASFNVEDFGPNRLKDLRTEEIRGRVAAFKKLAHFESMEV